MTSLGDFNTETVNKVTFKMFTDCDSHAFSKLRLYDWNPDKQKKI